MSELNALPHILIPDNRADLDSEGLTPLHIILEKAMSALSVSKSEIYDWEAETIAHSLRELGWTRDLDIQKVICAAFLKDGHIMIHDANSFQNIVSVINNEIPLAYTAEEILDPAQIAWAIIYLDKHYDDVLISLEVEKYVAECLHEQGFLTAPSEIRVFQVALDELNVREHSLKQDEYLNNRVSAYISIMEAMEEKYAE